MELKTMEEKKVSKTPTIWELMDDLNRLISQYEKLTLEYKSLFNRIYLSEEGYLGQEPSNMITEPTNLVEHLQLILNRIETINRMNALNFDGLTRII